MQIQKIILKKDVIKDFAKFINPFSEQYHVVTDTPRHEICKIMIEMFRPEINHKDNWMRKKINPKFKPPHRVNNGRLRSNLSRIRKIPQKINKLEEQLAEISQTTVDFVKKG